jgi:hypothetical protein
MAGKLRYYREPQSILIRSYRTSIADEMKEEHRRRVLGDEDFQLGSFR